jgi:DNA repair photolyase
MQDEATWMSTQTAEESMAKERYEYFTRPEPRDNMSEIYYEDDPFLGRAKCRDLRIGMLRNASDENRKTVKAYLEPFPHLRLDAAKPLQGWYQSNENESKQSRPRPCFTEAILTEPYGGYCAVGCQFCYINSGMRGYRGTGLISVPINYGLQIREQLRKMRRAAAGYFSSFTDPFTPLEQYYHNTQEAAAEFVKVGLPLFFLSRLQYPAWAIDMLTKNEHSYAQKSINTSDPEDWRHLSPGAMALDDHLDEITTLHHKGIYISIQVNPIVPGVTTNEQIVRLFRMLKDAGTDHVIVKFVEAAYSWAPALVQRIKKVFGRTRGEAFEALFTCNIGAEKTVDEAYRLRAHRLFSTYAAKFGLTYATCYEYEYERDETGKILNKVGKSIGRRFTTAAQCHGHQVPVYARKSEDEPFRPLDECPPSGCLYCADENEDNPGHARCGDELAGAAQALRFPDLKMPIGAGTKRGLVELPLVH